MYPRGSRASRGGTKRLNISKTTHALAAAGHDYTSSFEEDFPPLPETPSKSPAMKKKALDTEMTPAMLAQFEMLKSLINSRADSIECRMITLEEKFERVSSDLKAVTTRVTALEHKVTRVGQPIASIQRKMDEMETRMRRQNLRLDGLPESSRAEDLREKVINICQKLAPDIQDRLTHDIDVAHRLGRRIGTEEGSRPRTVIMHFVSRDCRDAVWDAAKKSTYLKQHDMRFKVDLSKGDSERKMKLWPYVKRAREAGKTAYYVGGRAFIDGEGEITLPE